MKLCNRNINRSQSFLYNGFRKTEGLEEQIFFIPAFQNVSVCYISELLNQDLKNPQLTLQNVFQKKIAVHKSLLLSSELFQCLHN